MTIKNWINYKKKSFFNNIKNKNLYVKLKIFEAILDFIIKKYFYIKVINKIEFKKFSQNGEDGVLKYIFCKLKLNKINSLEIGFDPLENNSIYNIFILKNKSKLNFFVEMDRKKCLILKGLSNIFSSSLGKNLHVINKKITTKNINKFVFKKFKKLEIDLFSIDIDGLDYHVLKKINFSPKVIIVEYNKYFQNNPISIVNDPKHKWNGRGDLYWGASIASMTSLLDKKGYFLAYLECSFVNAFFIKKNYLHLFNKKDFSKEMMKATNNKYSYYKQSDSLKGKKFLITN